MPCGPSFQRYASPPVCDGFKTFASKKKKAERPETFGKKRRLLSIREVSDYERRFAAYKL